MQNEIQIACTGLRAKELHDLIYAELSMSSDAIRLELRPNPLAFRHPATDPTVLVAIVAGISGTVAALINGLFGFLQKRQSRSDKIVIRGADGTTVEVPADTTQDRLLVLVELAKELDKPRIDIITSDPR